MSRYVAVGSSVAAGPGIAPAVEGSPRRAGRSQRNYPHLAAAALGLDLVDVTYSGATTAHILTEHQHGAPPQLEALDGSECLVTITIGGNDLGYVGGLMEASLPVPLRALARLLGRRSEPDFPQLSDGLHAVGEAVRRRAPQARVLFVDYPTLLPPEGEPTPGLPAEAVAVGRDLAVRLAEATAAAAQETGCDVVRVSEASRDHHPWSTEPWTNGPGLPRRGRTPFHPNAAGMRAAADLVVALTSET